jgi:hypothetical protein
MSDWIDETVLGSSIFCGRVVGLGDFSKAAQTSSNVGKDDPPKVSIDSPENDDSDMKGPVATTWSKMTSGSLDTGAGALAAFSFSGTAGRGDSANGTGSCRENALINAWSSEVIIVSAVQTDGLRQMD